MKRFAILLSLLLLPAVASAQWRYVAGSVRTVNPSQPVTLGGGTSAQELRFLEPSGSGSNYTAIKAPAQAANATYTLPNGLPSVSGQVLSSTDAGVMSWTTISSGLTIDSTAITGGGANRILFESATGKVSESANLTFGTTNTGIKITAGSATTIGAIIQGAAAHTANLTEWQNSAGAALVSVGSAGLLSSTYVPAANVDSATFGNGTIHLIPQRDSVALAPGIELGTALFQQSAGGHATIGTTGSGGHMAFVNGLGVAVRSDFFLGFGSTSDAIRGVDSSWTDTLLRRDSAAVIQMGIDAASPITQTFKAHDGLGTNIAGAALNIAGGKSTGAGAPGVLNLQTAPSGASGSALNALVTAAQFDATTTAGNTRFLIYDVDNATLERVTVGIADSGGVGYKLLRIAN